MCLKPPLIQYFHLVFGWKSRNVYSSPPTAVEIPAHLRNVSCIKPPTKMRVFIAFPILNPKLHRLQLSWIWISALQPISKCHKMSRMIFWRISVMNLSTTHRIWVQGRYFECTRNILQCVVRMFGVPTI